MEDLKYYSVKTKKWYDTEEEYKKAVEAYNKEQEEKEKEEQEKALKVAQLKEQRSARAKEVEEAFKAADEASKVANKKMDEFLKDYGSYHYTITCPNFNKVTRTLFDKFPRIRFPRWW